MATKDLPSWKKRRLEGKQDAVNAPDPFLAATRRVLDKIVPRLLWIAIGAGIILAAYIGREFWLNFRDKKQQRATAAFGKAALIGVQGRVSETPPSPDEVDEMAPPSFKTADEKHKAFLAEIDKVRSKFSGSKVSLRAELMQAATFYQMGKLDEAKQSYQDYLTKTSGSDPLRFVAQEGLGYTLEAKGDLPAAQTAFAAMDPDPTKPGNGASEERSLYHQARIFALQKQPAKAIELYQKLITDHPTSALKKDAQARLSALESQ